MSPLKREGNREMLCAYTEFLGDCECGSADADQSVQQHHQQDGQRHSEVTHNATDLKTSTCQSLFFNWNVVINTVYLYRNETISGNHVFEILILNYAKTMEES